MPIDYTVDQLLARVKRTAQIADDNGKVSDDELVQICDEEIQQNLYPSLLKVREDYLTVPTTIVLEQGISQYRLPFSTATSTIDHVQAIQTQSGQVINSWVVPRVETPQAASMYPSQTNGSQGWVGCYILFGDTLQLFPTPTQWVEDNVVLRVMHEWRPARLALVATASECAEFNENTDPALIEVTLSDPIAATMTTGDLVDFVPSVPPLMAILLDATIVDVASDPIIIVNPGTTMPRAEALSLLRSSPLPYMTPRGHSPVFPLPEAWFAAAVLACSASACRVIGDDAGFAANELAANQAIERLIRLQSSRVRKQPHIPFDRTSPLRRTGWMGGWWGGGGAR